MLVKKENSLVRSAGSPRKSLVNGVKLVCRLGPSVVSAGQNLVFATEHKLIGLKGVIGITQKDSKAQHKCQSFLRFQWVE